MKWFKKEEECEEECEHNYTARLHRTTYFDSVEKVEAQIPSNVSTELIKICAKCGEVDIQTYSVHLYDEDFAQSPIGIMLANHMLHFEDEDNEEK